jgi:Tfp pilus assembly protein PilN
MMTLKEIKDRNETLSSDASLTTLHKDIQRLISEIDRLQEELDSVHDYYTGAIERNVEATAQRCAEIAYTLPNVLDPESTCTDFDAIGDMIKAEFELED